jgi:membrane fusion protein (multidrug efflux system)
MKSESPIKKPDVRRSLEEVPARELRPRSRLRRVATFGAITVAIVAALVYGIQTLVFYAHHAVTDDAQIEGHVFPVVPKIAGYVTEVDVVDNQRVQAGDVLVKIDARDYAARVERAQASLESAKAAVAVARANVQAAATRRGKASADLRRYAALRDKEEIAPQEFDAARAAADSAAAELEAANRQVTAAEAEVAQRSAELETAKLDLSYTTLAAPSVGRVTKKNVEVGQYVQAGQALLAVVADERPWVVANYKETQLADVRRGEKAEITVDAYPGKVFHGTVDSLAAATGARFALLPPDNATGNFVKVVQRIPVKIVLDDPPDPDHPLRIGMNVNATVTTK